MRKLTALTEFLLQATGLPRENFYAFADSGDLQPIGRHLGLLKGEDGQPDREQIEIGIWKYDSVIQIERYPGDGMALAAHVLAWLQDNDPDRCGLRFPSLNVNINDGDTSDCDISCEFEERLTAVEDPDGPLFFDGKRWRLARPEIVPAESFSLSGRRKNA